MTVLLRNKKQLGSLGGKNREKDYEEEEYERGGRKERLGKGLLTRGLSYKGHGH